ncbi:hypothetical protein LS74_001280 [Helicobacter magdeburgensis]|uniref:Uncharacterized protein n=1 Tax=Helicobacter magdeburgensis TaxID=471858 RepID=A0A4V6I1S5_9HELI|nr:MULTISPECIES: hypothetical protein [Helicobacter]TLD93392.1 hypothetical protein LS74_001280 [Helicobacter magdeburgensis]
MKKEKVYAIRNITEEGNVFFLSQSRNHKGLKHIKEAFRRLNNGVEQVELGTMEVRNGSRIEDSFTSIKKLEKEV